MAPTDAPADVCLQSLRAIMDARGLACPPPDMCPMPKSTVDFLGSSFCLQEFNVDGLFCCNACVPGSGLLIFSRVLLFAFRVCFSARVPGNVHQKGEIGEFRGGFRLNKSARPQAEMSPEVPGSPRNLVGMRPRKFFDDSYTVSRFPRRSPEVPRKLFPRRFPGGGTQLWTCRVFCQNKRPILQ